LSDGELKNIITLDELLNEKYPSFHADIMKVDTDGFDFKVIRGADNVIKKDRPAIFFEWDGALLKEQGENLISIFDYLNNQGYKRALVYDNFGEALTIVNTDDTINLTLLMNYTFESNKRIYYYDVLLFHEDSDLKLEELKFDSKGHDFQNTIAISSRKNVITT
jgi:hypothetical protein